MEHQIKFVSGISTRKDPVEAAEHLIEQVETQIGDRPVDLLMVFLSAHYTQSGPELVDRLCAALEPKVILGCTAENVIGREEEVEGEPAVSLVAAHLPGVHLAPFLLQPDEWHSLLLDSEKFRRAVGVESNPNLFILLADPFSTPVGDVLVAFNDSFPGVPTVGGMASGALRPNGNLLLLNEQVANAGLVGVALAGALDVDLIVSQGCRPIWRPFTITSAQKNIIYSLEGQPPLTMLQDLIPDLPEEDRELLQNGLFVGRAVQTEGEPPGRGDFLIRGVTGLDWENGSIAVGDVICEGDVIQFHLRDALTAQEDLEMMLIPQSFREMPGGALLFTCNGRGSRLYGFPNGDISVIQKILGGAPLAGFFCAGEIGPLRGQNLLHGHTAILALFRQPQEINR